MSLAEKQGEGKGPVLRVDAECCLTGMNSAVEQAITSHLTIANPKYQAAVRYGRWVGKGLKPKLSFYRREQGQLFFPRGFANQAVRLCRRHMGCTPEIIDHRRRLADLALSFHGRLRPYQETAVQAVLRHSFGVLESGTGSGKTVMALQILAQRQQPTLILVHNRELLHQWQQRIQEFLRIEAGQAGDGRVDIQPVTVGIVNTVRRRLDDLVVRFGHLIVDECHRVPASLFTETVSAFDCWYMLGLSATAYRREDGMTRLITAYMGDCVHRIDEEALVQTGAVVRPEFIQRPTAFEMGYWSEYPRLIKALTRDVARNRQIVADICQLIGQEHTGVILVVSDRVAHCRLLLDMLAQRGIQATLLCGRLPPEARQQVVSDVQQGRIQVLIATIQLIGEGFDCPDLSTIVLATPIKFEGRLKQVVGRVMRPRAGKRALVLDYADVRVPALARSAEHRCRLFARSEGLFSVPMGS